MRRIALLLALTLAAPLAHAEDSEPLAHAAGLYKAGHLPEAATELFELANGQEGSTKQEAEFLLAETLLSMRLYGIAFNAYAPILDAGPAHPHYADALVSLVKISEALDDNDLVPARLNREYDRASAVLARKDFPQDVLAKINYLVARHTYDRKRKYNEVLTFVDTVSPESSYYARAQYLRALAFSSMGKNAEALQAFEDLIRLKGERSKYVELDSIRDLSLLGAARVNYAMGEYAKAIRYYESVPRFSQRWDQALFENGWARFQNDDYGGALGALQALHAPQFEGSFQPESWILNATVYFYSCLYDESKFAVRNFEQTYLPMQAKIKPLLDGQHDAAFYGKLIDGAESDALPRAVRSQLLANQRVQGLKRFLDELDREKQAIADVRTWSSTPFATEQQQSLQSLRDVVLQATGVAVRDQLAYADSAISTYHSQATIIRFETTKAEKEIVETGTNVQSRLDTQKLLRPGMPAEEWEYWPFQGEFWIDEIGYYQYTLKSGCAARPKVE